MTSVLIAEDDGILAFELEECLRANGYSLVDSVVDVASAEHSLALRVPQAAIVDGALRGGDAASLIYDLLGRGVKVFLSSGAQALGDAALLESCTVLDKPIDLDRLVRRLGPPA